MTKSLEVKVKKLHKDAILPSKSREDDSGFDLHALEDVEIIPGETKLVKTGIAISLPSGWEAQVRPRSGLSLGTKMRVQLGTVDNPYRGDIGIIVDNIRAEPVVTRDWISEEKGILVMGGSYYIKKGDRIAQLVITELPMVTLVETDDLDETDRGDKGFGQSGVK